MWKFESNLFSEIIQKKVEILQINGINTGQGLHFNSGSLVITIHKVQCFLRKSGAEKQAFVSLGTVREINEHVGIYFFFSVGRKENKQQSVPEGFIHAACLGNLRS